MAIFLAGVANAEIFDGDTLFASARTLVDSSITIGVTAEDIRGGQSNALIGKYFHDTVFDLKMTDALFNLEYLAANVGAQLEVGGDVFRDEVLVASAAGVLTLGAVAKPIRSGGLTYAYIKKATATTDKRVKYSVTATNTITGVEANSEYCVRYMYTNAAASKIQISSQFIPATLTVILTAALYSGDSNNPSTGTKVGSLTIKVPRFLLSGAQELAMSATGAAQTSFEGSALASGGSGCEGNAIYAEIIQALFDARWYTEANGLVIEDSLVECTVAEATTSVVNTSPTVYAWYPNAAPKMLSNTILAAQESELGSAEKSTLVYAMDAKTTGLSINSGSGVISGTPAAGTATITVKAMQNGKQIAGMDASAQITITA